MRRKEFAAKVWSKLVAFEKKNRLLKTGQRVLAAVSGGPDSVCLAHYLASQKRRRNIEVEILHVHHGLRGRAADLDAAFVERLGKKLGIGVTVARSNAKTIAKERGRGIEDAARALRYAALKAHARRQHCQAVATGHQLDDQAETVLLNLVRGTRLKALGAIAPERALAPRLRLIRPLLPLSRKEVLAYLKIHGLKYRVDSSNADLDFTRNWLRRRILPALEKRQPRIREHLSGIAEQARFTGRPPEPTKKDSRCPRPPGGRRIFWRGAQEARVWQNPA